MKALIFLVVFAAIIAVLVWRMRKNEAEAARVRRDALKKRKKQDSEALNQDMEIIWPVIIKPVSGKSPPGDESQAHEPTMTAMEFEPAEPKTARQGGSS